MFQIIKSRQIKSESWQSCISLHIAGVVRSQITEIMEIRFLFLHAAMIEPIHALWQEKVLNQSGEYLLRGLQNKIIWWLGWAGIKSLCQLMVTEFFFRRGPNVILIYCYSSIQRKVNYIHLAARGYSPDPFNFLLPMCGVKSDQQSDITDSYMHTLWLCYVTCCGYSPCRNKWQIINNDS